MDCTQCRITNPHDNRYCGKCGAELGHTLDETVRRKGFRDRLATEMEITEAVVERLIKWWKWLGLSFGAVVVVFGILVGKNYLDIHATVAAAKSQIENSVNEGRKDIGF